MQYLFGLMEKDFLPEVHLLTGLIDCNERPIVRLGDEPSDQYPMGFGNHEEFNEVSRRNSG